jgi:hypothetical protein
MSYLFRKKQVAVSIGDLFSYKILFCNKLSATMAAPLAHNN